MTKRKYTNNKKEFLSKYKLSRYDILSNKGVYLQDFDSWDLANKHSKNMNTTLFQYGLKGHNEIYMSVRVNNAKQQRWIVKTIITQNNK